LCEVSKLDNFQIQRLKWIYIKHSCNLDFLVKTYGFDVGRIVHIIKHNPSKFERDILSHELRKKLFRNKIIEKTLIELLSDPVKAELLDMSFLWNNSYSKLLKIQILKVFPPVIAYSKINFLDKDLWFELLRSNFESVFIHIDKYVDKEMFDNEDLDLILEMNSVKNTFSISYIMSKFKNVNELKYFEKMDQDVENFSNNFDISRLKSLFEQDLQSDLQLNSTTSLALGYSLLSKCIWANVKGTFTNLTLESTLERIKKIPIVTLLASLDMRVSFIIDNDIFKEDLTYDRFDKSPRHYFSNERRWINFVGSEEEVQNHLIKSIVCSRQLPQAMFNFLNCKSILRLKDNNFKLFYKKTLMSKHLCLFTDNELFELFTNGCDPVIFLHSMLSLDLCKRLLPHNIDLISFCGKITDIETLNVILLERKKLKNCLRKKSNFFSSSWIFKLNVEKESSLKLFYSLIKEELGVFSDNLWIPEISKLTF
jgi:hypothetical protein